jgi:hypothetical protein
MVRIRDIPSPAAPPQALLKLPRPIPCGQGLLYQNFGIRGSSVRCARTTSGNGEQYNCLWRPDRLAFPLASDPAIRRQSFITLEWRGLLGLDSALVRRCLAFGLSHPAAQLGFCVLGWSGALLNSLFEQCWPRGQEKGPPPAPTDYE